MDGRRQEKVRRSILTRFASLSVCCLCVRSLFVSLLEEMYPVDEVGTILDGVKQLIKGQVTEEMEKLAQQSVLYLRQVFLQAEGNGVAINVDLSQLDDASVTRHATRTSNTQTRVAALLVDHEAASSQAMQVSLRLRSLSPGLNAVSGLLCCAVSVRAVCSCLALRSSILSSARILAV